jgi:hypothetical protein
MPELTCRQRFKGIAVNIIDIVRHCVVPAATTWPPLRMPVAEAFGISKALRRRSSAIRCPECQRSTGDAASCLIERLRAFSFFKRWSRAPAFTSVASATSGHAVFASPLSPSRAYRWHSGAVGRSVQIAGGSWCCMYRAMTRSTSRAAAMITQLLSCISFGT